MLRAKICSTADATALAAGYAGSVSVEPGDEIVLIELDAIAPELRPS